MKSIIAKGIILIVSLVIVSLAGYYISASGVKFSDNGVKISENLLKSLGYSCDKSQSGDIIIQGDKTTTNLVTVERMFEHTYQYSTEWRGSTKEIILRAEFRALGGVDMSKHPVTIHFSSEGNPNLDMKEMRGLGKLIACEKVKVLSTQDVDGVWNKIQERDRLAAENNLLISAREKIERDSDLKQKAEDNFLRFLVERSKNMSGDPTPIQLPPLN
ncbi:MAG: hypothetical protein RSD12_06860 [Akkermansia sp.]